MIKESKEAHQLIEEFMLLANKAVAQYISEFKFDKKPVPLPYRVHDVPDKVKLLPFISFAHKFGHKYLFEKSDLPKRLYHVCQILF